MAHFGSHQTLHVSTSGPIMAQIGLELCVQRLNL